MRTIGIITNIITDGFIPLIDIIEITIYDKEKNQVVTIYPSNYKRDYPFQLVQTVEYDKDNDSIKPFDKLTDMTEMESKQYLKGLTNVLKDRVLAKKFENYLYSPLDKPPKIKTSPRK